MNKLKIIKYLVIPIATVILVISIIYIFSKVFGSFTISHQNSTAVIKELKEISSLETASFTIEKVIDSGTNGNKFQELLFGDRILLIANGTVVAGFDLSEINEKNIEIKGNVIKITLPSPKILHTKLDSSLTRVYDRKLGYLNKGNKDLESKTRLDAENSIRQAACSSGILKEASKNGRSQITTIFKALDFKNVIVQIPDGKCI